MRIGWAASAGRWRGTNGDVVTAPHNREEPSIASEYLTQVLGWLGRAANVQGRPLSDILCGITEAAARTLRVARVNVWLYDVEHQGLTCIEGFDARTGKHEAGETLLARDHPNYFRSLELLRNISALDAREDSRTEELDAYLRRHEVTTILDVPIVRSGQVVGVVCHEHAGEPRSFGVSDRLFAGSIGDLVALVLETAQRVELEREQARMRESVARMAQIESLGWLAAGVAHDFRNLLTVILTNTEFLQRALVDTEQREAAQSIAEATFLARDLCQQLQAYAGKGSNDPRACKIDTVIADTIRAFRGRVPSQVVFQTQLDTHLPPALLDRIAIGRLVMNLLVNALEALPPEGGTVRLVLRECEPSEADLALGYDFRVAPGRCALLEVTDTGAGIKPELLARVAEPFYTTKERGSGLGLATVLGTVRAHRGVFRIESTLGHGTSCRIWIPLEAIP